MKVEEGIKNLKKALKIDTSDIIKAWAFENSEEEGRYLSDGPEFADWEHERGDTKDLTDALLVWMRDGSEPGEKELAEFEKGMENLRFYSWENIRPHYVPVLVDVTKRQIREIERRG